MPDLAGGNDGKRCATAAACHGKENDPKRTKAWLPTVTPWSVHGPVNEHAEKETVLPSVCLGGAAEGRQRYIEAL